MDSENSGSKILEIWGEKVFLSSGRHDYLAKRLGV